MHLGRIILTVALGAALSGCNPKPQEEPEPQIQATPESEAEAGDTVSILRPEVEQENVKSDAESLETLTVSIGFPEGGSSLDAAAVAELEAILQAPQLKLGLPITLGAHGDSAGTDKANLDSSEKRGLAVAAWLIEKGVDAERITVIAFGEQNPIAPNALPDGSPNEAGRATNRRVEISIAGNAPAPNESKAEQGASNSASSAELSVETGD